MNRQHQFHFTRQPHARARAVALTQQQNQQRITMLVGYSLASAIIVLSMAYLPFLTGCILTNLNIVPTH